MSIEITGPERYEFQYHVTLELVLRFWNHDVHAVVDSGGEDSTLDIELDGSRVELELQVKGAEHHKKAIDANVLREYLAHFPSRDSTGCLLERLLTQPNKLVLLACAQRARDFASPLTVRSDWRGNAHRNPPLLVSDAKSFLDQVAKSGPLKDTALERARSTALSSLGNTTSPAALNAAFMRLCVQDNLTKESVIARMLDHLRILGVPSDKGKDVLLQMLQQVRDSKGSRTDVVPALKTVLNAQIAPSVRPSHYVARGIEKDWIEELTDRRALLFSGPPRCGKTDTANWVAGALQELGFEVTRTGLVDEAERVLLDQRRSQILVVLDDPLGSDFEVNSKAGQALRSLDRLIRDLRQDRRLIVSQSQEVLLAARGTDSLGKVRTGNLSWHDLGKYPPEFLSQVWDMQAQRNQVPEDIKIAVASAIAVGQIDVPAGVLVHVAAYHEKLQGADVVRQAQSLASESAIDFAMTLSSSGAQAVMRALAIGSTAIETSADRELAFILGAGQELDMPESYGAIWSPGSQFDKPFSAPSYTEEPILPDRAKQHLVTLEQHRVLRRMKANHFEFSHPYYRAAARAVVKQAVSVEKDDVLSAIRRGLLAPSSSTSAATARNLWWLHRDLNESLGLGRSLVDLAEKGLRWHFPTTRDLCYEFLLDAAKAEPEKYLKSLQYWIDSMARIELEDVIWDQGDPFFPTEEGRSSLSFLREQPTPDTASVGRTVAALRAGDALPTPGSGVEALRFFKENPSTLEADVLLRLLAFSEGLIRADAAHAWLLVERTDDDEILERLGRDFHPSVVSRIVDAVASAWNTVSPNRRARLSALLQASSVQPEGAAIIVSRLLSYFSDNDDSTWSYERASEPWSLVGEVLAPALKNFPDSFRMAGMRLYGVCNAALAYLSPTSSWAVIHAWINWLQVRIAAGHLPDDYMLGVVTSVIDAPTLAVADRLVAIEILLTLPSTGAVLVFVANLVGRWDDLQENERSMVMSVLASGRDDVVWMKAAALTQKYVPAEIQKLLLGTVDGVRMPANCLIDYLPSQLLTACVQMHRGSPQPLWYLGHHHDDSRTWKDVIRQLARMPTHPLFEDCLDEIFNSSSTYGAEELVEIIYELDASSRVRVFDLLLAWKTRVVGVWYQREFDLLLELAPNEKTRAEMIDRILREADLIIERVEDVSNWSHRLDVREALENHFPNDFAIHQMWDKLKNLNVPDTAQIRTNISELLSSQVESFPPKLPSTHWDVNRYLRALGVEGDFLARTASARDRALAAWKALRSSEVGRPTALLPDWIGPQ